ncbi:MAG: GntR family transcriptional regulator [Bacillota bacterium]|nr:GntR family transcriptional regulator [Bacillota bacterium]
MGKIDKEGSVPYYLQIKDILKNRIKNNIYPRETLIPSENELSSEFGVTRATVRNALKELKKEDLIYTEKGKGSIVKGSKIKQSLMEFYSFGRRFKQNEEEHEAYSEIVEKKEIICPSDVREHLNIRSEDKIYEITRIRYVEEEPVMVEISYLPQKLFPDLFDYDMEHFSLYDMIEFRYKKSITKGKEYIQPMISGTKESQLLNIEKGSPVFLVKRITFSGKKPVEYRKSIIRGDKYVFYTEFS